MSDCATGYLVNFNTFDYGYTCVLQGVLRRRKKINFDKNKAMLCQVVVVFLWIIQDLYYKAENQLTQLFSILEM